MTLQEIQRDLKCNKSQYNSFGNYHYRSVEDILEAVKPLLSENILTLSDEIVNIGGFNYVKATAKFITGKECVEVSAFAKEATEQKGMSAAQVTGSTSSYARKYALNGLFCIDDTKDDDYSEKTEQKQETKQNFSSNYVQVETTSNLECNSCGAIIDNKVASFSKARYGKYLCFTCQKSLK